MFSPVSVPAPELRQGKGAPVTEPELASRAKFGEAAFLDVYQKLYEAPDPAPILSGAMVRGLTRPRHQFGAQLFGVRKARASQLQGCLLYPG